MSRSRSHLARLAAAVACAALVVASSASAQDEHHHHDGGGAGRQAPWAGRGGAPQGGRGGPGPGWDERRYNGYWVGPRWYFGAPQGPAYQAPGFRPGFVPWRRGAYLPPQYLSYGVADYWRYHLRRPPYGYEWVQVGGEFLLVSMGTGLIFDVVTGY